MYRQVSRSLALRCGRLNRTYCLIKKSNRSGVVASSGNLTRRSAQRSHDVCVGSRGSLAERRQPAKSGIVCELEFNYVESVMDSFQGGLGIIRDRGRAQEPPVGRRGCIITLDDLGAFTMFRDEFHARKEVVHKWHGEAIDLGKGSTFLVGSKAGIADEATDGIIIPALDVAVVILAISPGAGEGDASAGAERGKTEVDELATVKSSQK